MSTLLNLRALLQRAKQGPTVPAPPVYTAAIEAGRGTIAERVAPPLPIAPAPSGIAGIKLPAKLAADPLPPARAAVAKRPQDFIAMRGALAPAPPPDTAEQVRDQIAETPAPYVPRFQGLVRGLRSPVGYGQARDLQEAKRAATIERTTRVVNRRGLGVGVGPIDLANGVLAPRSGFVEAKLAVSRWSPAARRDVPADVIDAMPTTTPVAKRASSGTYTDPTTLDTFDTGDAPMTRAATSLGLSNDPGNETTAAGVTGTTTDRSEPLQLAFIVGVAFVAWLLFRGKA